MMAGSTRTGHDNGRSGFRPKSHMTEDETRHLLVDLAASLFARGFSVGSAGNISARLDDGYLITPTNSSLGRLDPARLSRLDAEFQHVAGDKPSKEVFMHRAFYRARPDAGAVVHLHSTMATAVACLPDVDAANPIPPLTPYFVMRVGRSMPIVEYYRPGDPAMEPAIHAAAARCARGAAGQSWSGGVGQDADRRGLCGGGTGGGREALSAAARHGAATADAAAGG